eukprot:scaffold425_cov175-Amphora_coffeaeformis.AAC.70
MEQNNRIVEAMGVSKSPKCHTGDSARPKSLQRVKISELQAGKFHHSQVLYDETGRCELAIYDLHNAKEKRRLSQCLAMLQPFYKRHLDGTLRVCVDDLSDIIVDIVPPFQDFIATKQSEICQDTAATTDRVKDPKALNEGFAFLYLEAQLNTVAEAKSENEFGNEMSDSIFLGKDGVDKKKESSSPKSPLGRLPPIFEDDETTDAYCNGIQNRQRVDTALEETVEDDAILLLSTTIHIPTVAVDASMR